MTTLNKTAVLMCALALSACASTPKTDSTEAFAPTTRSTVIGVNEANKSFPELDKTYVKAVQRYDASELNKLGVGLNKNQVRFIMGNPHFSEGIFKVKTWNYLIGLQKPNSNEYQLCQLRVDFDKDNLVEDLNWREKTCAELLLAAPVAQEQPVTEAAPLKRFTSNNVLFNFNRSSANDVVGGSVAIDNLVADINNNIKEVKQVKVVGYADRIGRADANLALSQARAKTIATVLATRGIPAEVISSEGQGATNTFVTCTGIGKNQQVISCLEPNRRVVVSVTGY